MKTIRYSILIATALVLMLLGDAPPDVRFGLQLVPEAQAVFGVGRRHVRRWAVIGTAAVASTATATAAQQEAAAGQQQAATAQQQQAVVAQQQAVAPPPTATGKPLPLGTVVSSLPGGCKSTPVDGVQYYYCSGNFYRAVFQGNKLVYVTAKP